MIQLQKMTIKMSLTAIMMNPTTMFVDMIMKMIQIQNMVIKMSLTAIMMNPTTMSVDMIMKMIQIQNMVIKMNMMKTPAMMNMIIMFVSESLYKNHLVNLQ